MCDKYELSKYPTNLENLMTHNAYIVKVADAELRVDLIEARLRFLRMTATAMHSVSFLQSVEGNGVDEAEEENDRFKRYLSPHNLTYQNFFAGMLLTNVIAEVEVYFVEVMKLLLRRYPKKLGATQFRLEDILDKEPEELVILAAEERLSKLMYKKPSEYISELAEILAVSAAPINPYWGSFVEAKARRDLGAHNAWKINDTYRRKVAEAGIDLSTKIETELLPNFDYINGVITQCNKIVMLIDDQLQQKYKLKIE